MELQNESEAQRIFSQLEEAGYDFAVAIATEEEVANGSACGQLAIIAEP